MCQFIEDSTKVPQTCPNSGHLRKISLQQTRGLQRPEQSQRQLSERLRWMDTRPEKSNCIKGHNGRGGQGERKCRPLSPVIRHPPGIILVSAKLDPSESRSFLLRKTRQLCRCFFGFRQIITGPPTLKSAIRTNSKNCVIHRPLEEPQQRPADKRTGGFRSIKPSNVSSSVALHPARFERAAAAAAATKSALRRVPVPGSRK